MGLCLPRNRMATSEASLPTTRPSASIITHFFSTSAGLAEKVFMSDPLWGGRQTGAVRGYLSVELWRVNPLARYFEYLSSLWCGGIFIPLGSLHRYGIGRSGVRDEILL